MCPAVALWKSTCATSTQSRRDAVLDRMLRRAPGDCQRRGVSIRPNSSMPTRPRNAPCRIDALAASCEESCLAYDRMISRAYHDSLFMSRIAPTAMLFIPCRAGVSHRPDEYASSAGIATGVNVLALTLARLAG